MTTAASHAQGLGEENSIWFKLTPLLQGRPAQPDDASLMQMAERYGGVIAVNMANQRVVFLSEPEHFKHVLVTKADNYIKYFDGLKPIFGKSMITHDGALWQKIRMPQQPAFHPDMFAEYIPYFLDGHPDQDGHLGRARARPARRFEMVEQTWTLAADMICKALFDRDMPFNPHVVFKCVKTYTDVMNHKAIRLKKQAGEMFEMTEEDAAKAMEAWCERAAGRDGRRSARAARAHAAEDDRGGRRRSDDPGVRPAAGDRRDQAVPVGRHRDDGADARLGAVSDCRSTRKPPSASAAKASRSTATASRPRPTTRRSPTRAPSSRRRCASIRRSGA